MVPTSGRHPRHFQPGRAGADHDDLFRRPAAPADDVRDRRLAPGGGVVDAQRLAALIDAVEAIGGADAGADLVLAPLHHLLHDVRIGDVGARHAHHVELAGGDGMARRGDVGDARGMEGREFRGRPHLAGEIEMRGGAHAGDRDDPGERGVGLDRAADDVEEIHLARLRQKPGDLHALILRQAGGKILVRHHADADDEFFAHRRAHGVQHHVREAQPVFERAAIFVVAMVGGGGPEAVHQMAVGLELDAVEAGRPAALGGGSIVGDDALDVPVLRRLGKGAVRRFAHRRGREHRQPVGLVPAGAAAEMGDLDHHLAVVLVAGVGQFGKPGHDGVVIEMQVAEGRRAVARNDRRSCRHGQRHAALGLLRVIEPVALLRHAVFRIGRLVAGRHHPVLQCQVLQPVGLQKRIVAGHGRYPKSMLAVGCRRPGRRLHHRKTQLSRPAASVETPEGVHGPVLL